jgi:two-component system sensor histidine kinase HydH
LASHPEALQNATEIVKSRTARVVWTRVGMAIAVLAIFLLAYLDLRREQARALDDFTAEQSALARAFAGTISARMAGGTLSESGSAAEAVASDAPFEGVPIDGGAVPICWLVIDGQGRWVKFGEESDRSRSRTSLEWRSDSEQFPSQVRSLLERMRTEKDGASLLDRDAASALGLGRRTAVAGFSRILVKGRRPWSLAVVTSARRMRDRAWVAGWRLGAATGLAGIFVALFGLVMTRQQRREQMLAEALRLSEATSALRERSEKIVEAIPVGVLTLGPHLEVTSANPFLVERGVSSKGPLVDAMPKLTMDERSNLEALILKARATGRPISRLALRVHLGSSEEVREVDAYAIPLARPLPDADCFLVLHDRTELRLLERNLVRAEKLATIGTLAAGVAHEVGTPLGIISGRAEQILARLSEGKDERLRKAVSSILGQVDKVSKTIRQLLDFARTRPIEASAVTPTQILHNAAALLEHRFRQGRVRLEVKAPPTVPATMADPGQLEQVFVNLLMNACDACPTGGTVIARATGHAEQVCFEVVDDGTGIPEEHLALVLDPFFTTKKRGQGTGLGLTIAADIVKNHGGALEVESTVGQGTTVRFFLPRATKEPHVATNSGR